MQTYALRLHCLNKRPTGLNVHLSIRDFTLTSCHRGSYLYINGLFCFKCILNFYWNNYFNSGRYFNSGCDVKLSLKFILNHYWNNYFNRGRYFNISCNNALQDSYRWGDHGSRCWSWVYYALWWRLPLYTLAIGCLLDRLSNFYRLDRVLIQVI